MSKRVRVWVMAVVLAMALGSAGVAAPPVDLTTGDASLILANHGPAQELKDPAGAPGSGVTMSGGDGSRATPWVYAFTGGGLNVNTYKVKAEYDAVELGNTDGGANFTLNMGGADVYGTSGNTSFSTAEDTTGWNGYGSGDIRIYNVDTVDVGTIDTHNKAHYEGPGSVYIGEASGVGAGPATGNVRIDSINATDTQQVGGYVKIYGVGDVLIQDSPAGVAGDIDAHGPGARSAGSPYKQVIVVQQGDFVVQDILTNLKIANASGNVFGNYNNLGGVKLDGGGGGSATIRDIDTSIDIRDAGGVPLSSFKYWEKAGYVEITNYENVIVGNIDAHHATGGGPTGSGRAGAGNVDITNIAQDITILGNVDLGVWNAAIQDKGVLNLQCGGTITLEQGLDLSKMLYASFDSGPATAEILGAIIGSDGDPASAANIGNLRTPLGDVIYYDPALNPDLLSDTYDLADLGGDPGAGGTLEPMASAIPEPAGLALFGLAALLKRRRR